MDSTGRRPLLNRFNKLDRAPQRARFVQQPNGTWRLADGLEPLTADPHDAQPIRRSDGTVDEVASEVKRIARAARGQHLDAEAQRAAELIMERPEEVRRFVESASEKVAAGGTQRVRARPALPEVEPIRRPDGSIDETATEIKKLMTAARARQLALSVVG
ncbi:MAG: hypothetical protein M0015_16685 [Betaproteobacteria bacterium]|nr:hypothetical protein [Betaproteobacteria bacterium]